VALILGGAGPLSIDVLRKRRRPVMREAEAMVNRALP